MQTIKPISERYDEELPFPWNAVLADDLAHLYVGFKLSTLGEHGSKNGSDKAAKEAVDEYKMAMGCTDCGLHPEISEVLEYDHLPQFKKYSEISRLVQLGAGGPTLRAEIAKCEVVCANCHRVRTYNRRRGN